MEMAYDVAHRRKLVSPRYNGPQRDESSPRSIHPGRMASSKELSSDARGCKLDKPADQLSFDYSSLDPSVAKFLRGQADRIRRQCMTTVVQLGNSLIQSKRYLCHGNFLTWVECEVGITARTAQLYMRAALWTSNKGKVVSDFPASLVYLLSAPKTPSDFADQIVERAAAGMPVTLETIRRELKEFIESGETKSHRDPRDATFPPINRKTGRYPFRVSASDAVTKVMAILARDLPEEQFALVRDVLTTETAIDRSEAATIVAQALSAIRAQAAPSA
jgi:hypothetical protein